MADRKGKKRAFQIDAILFDLIIFGFFLLLAIISINYNPRARAIPLALGIGGSFMMLVQLLVDAFPRVRSTLRFVSSSGLLADESSFQPKKPDKSKESEAARPDETAPSSQKELETEAVEWWRLFRVILWLVGFIVLLSFTNYLIAVGAFVVLVTRLEAGESWKRSIILGFCVDLGFFILFEVLLQAQL